MKVIVPQIVIHGPLAPLTRQGPEIIRQKVKRDKLDELEEFNKSELSSRRFELLMKEIDGCINDAEAAELVEITDMLRGILKPIDRCEVISKPNTNLVRRSFWQRLREALR